MNVDAVLKTKGCNVYTARPESTLLDISRQLSAKRVGVIVVIGDAGSVAGIISERDLVNAISKHGPNVLSEPVANVMTKEVNTCERTNTIDEMMDLMTKGRFRHVPVIENGALIGLISIGDVVKHHIAEVEMEVTAMRCYLNG